MNFTKIFIILILFISCSNKENKLELYANYTSKFEKQEIIYPDNDFSISIPKNWEWKAPYQENANDILGLFAHSEPNSNGLECILLLKKYKSTRNNKDLKSEFDYLVNQIQNHSQINEIVDSSTTTIFNEESYFFHTKSDSNTNGASEILNFLLNSGKEGVFYNLTVSAPQTTGFNTEMAELIQSLKTFKKLK